MGDNEYCVYDSDVPYDAGHPKALAVYCSDGRFTRAVEDLLRHLGHARLDTLTMPGGPALLNSWTASILETDHVTRAAEFLIRGHEIDHVVLLAHAGCGYYKKRLAGSGAADVKKTQLDDLRTAARALAGIHRGLDITLFYASPEGGRVRFDPVDLEGDGTRSFPTPK